MLPLQVQLLHHLLSIMVKVSSFPSHCLEIDTFSVCGSTDNFKCFYLISILFIDVKDVFIFDVKYKMLLGKGTPL